MQPIEKLGKKVISNLTTRSLYGWPPECAGLIYQPKRPCQSELVSVDAGEKAKKTSSTVR